MRMVQTISAPLPKLRSDIVISRQVSAQGPALVVKDPAVGRFFRFREIEGYVLQQLDGRTTLEEIRHKVEQSLEASLPQLVLEQFIAKLSRLGLLEQEGPVQKGLQRTQRRLRGNAFYLRVKAFDPDRLLDWLLGRLRFLFTRTFMVLSAAAIGVAVALTATNWTEMLLDLPRLYSFSSLLLAYLTMLVVITGHEFAHGLTCKFFGGSVREMGFMLLYFQPAFYCNVSDAWLFAKKSHRLSVTFAGAYFEIFLWALATMVWRVTDSATLVNYFALVVLATSGIKTLFNLNPLIKLDGYYLLSDWLEVPNLRARAVGHLGGWLRKLWGTPSALTADVSARERKIFWIYGIMAWSYSTWLLGLLMLYFGGYLVGHYQAWGFAVFTLLVSAFFQQSWRKPLRNGLQALGTCLKMNQIMRTWTKRIVRLAVVAGLGAALLLVRLELKIGGPFVVLPVRNADVRAAVEGILEEICVEEGDTVHKGAPIVRLSDRDLRAELRKVMAQLEETQARLKLLKAGTRPEEIELAQTSLAKADERVRYATNRLGMDKTLFEERLISKREYEDSKELVMVREKERQEAQDKLKLLLAGSRQEEIEATAAELTRLQAQQRYLEEQLQLLTVFSPIDGVITTPKLKDKVGQAVKKGDLIARVHLMKTVLVEIAVPEKEIADVALGQKVELKAQAYPGRRFEGTVEAVAPIATEPDDPRSERTVRVTTHLDNISLLLKPEMTGHAKICAGQQRLLDLVGRRLVRFFKVEFWSWW